MCNKFIFVLALSVISFVALVESNLMTRMKNVEENYVVLFESDPTSPYLSVIQEYAETLRIRVKRRRPSVQLPESLITITITAEKAKKEKEKKEKEQKEKEEKEKKEKETDDGGTKEDEDNTGEKSSKEKSSTEKDDNED